MIEFREAGLEDVNEIARVESDTKRESDLAEPAIYDVQRLRSRWEGYVRRLRHPQHAEGPRIVFAATLNGQMVGFIAGHFSRRYETRPIQSTFSKIFRERDRRRVAEAAGCLVHHSSAPYNLRRHRPSQPIQAVLREVRRSHYQPALARVGRHCRRPGRAKITLLPNDWQESPAAQP